MPPGAEICGLTSISHVGPHVVKVLKKPPVLLLTVVTRTWGEPSGSVILRTTVSPALSLAIHAAPTSGVVMPMPCAPGTAAVTADAPATLLYSMMYLAPLATALVTFWTKVQVPRRTRTILPLRSGVSAG